MTQELFTSIHDQNVAEWINGRPRTTVPAHGRCREPCVGICVPQSWEGERAAPDDAPTVVQHYPHAMSAGKAAQSTAQRVLSIKDDRFP